MYGKARQGVNLAKGDEELQIGSSIYAKEIPPMMAPHQI